jgi:hypothetical protein
MDIGRLVEWIKLSPRHLLPLSLFTGSALFTPEKWLAVFGIVGFVAFRMGIALSALGEGLREAARHFGRVALRRLRLPLSPAGSRYSQRGFITHFRHHS